MDETEEIQLAIGVLTIGNDPDQLRAFIEGDQQHDHLPRLLYGMAGLSSILLDRLSLATGKSREQLLQEVSQYVARGGRGD